MYSVVDYVELLIIFGECGRNAREAAIVFSDRFPDRPSPDPKTILKVLARAQETGKVLPNRNEIGDARTARTLANEEAILNIVEADGTRSIGEIAQELDVSSRSVHRVLKENRLSTIFVCNTSNQKITLFDEIFVFGCLIKRQKMKILFRGSCFRTNQVLVGRDVSAIEICKSGRDNPRAIYLRTFQRIFSVNLWAGLVGDAVVSQNCTKIKQAFLDILYFQIGPFEFPMRCTQTF
jgi:hypothetical protein